MPERALRCPQCHAPLTASRFSRSAVCAFCGTTVVLDEEAISAERFREAFRHWNAPERVVAGGVMEIGGSFWAPGRFVAKGERTDVYRVTRARWPTEQGLMKVLRDRRDREAFDRERETLNRLQRSAARGATAIQPRLPQPILLGDVASGPHSGTRVMVLQWSGGFRHTFDEVRAAYPQGIPARASIWIWRRILETLAFLHADGLVHGAVLPQHLLLERGEHGVALVGFSAAGDIGSPIAPASADRQGFYPPAALPGRPRPATLDLAMSARSVAMLLGAGSARGVAAEDIVHEVQKDVPPRLAALLAEVSGWPLPEPDPRAHSPSGPPPERDAWTLREELGTIANEDFGAPSFCPIAMPDDTRED